MKISILIEIIQFIKFEINVKPLQRLYFFFGRVLIEVDFFNIFFAQMI